MSLPSPRDLRRQSTRRVNGNFGAKSPDLALARAVLLSEKVYTVLSEASNAGAHTSFLSRKAFVEVQSWGLPASDSEFDAFADHEAPGFQVSPAMSAQPARLIASISVKAGCAALLALIAVLVVVLFFLCRRLFTVRREFPFSVLGRRAVVISLDLRIALATPVFPFRCSLSASY